MAAEVRGRALPGRFSLERVRTAESAWGATALAAAVLVTRLPFQTRYLANWDAAQFALGMRHFDLAHHQPHPPGYIGYVALGRALQPLFGDANATLVAISIAAEMGAAAAGFLFARALFGRFAGWVTGAALAGAPLFWYYGEVANTYALEPLLVLVIAWFCWRLWEGEAASAYPAALALGLAGALRPSTMVLLAPLFLLSLRRSAPPSVRLRALGIGALAVAAWAVPLLWLSGGPLAFLRASLQLGGSVTGGTAVWNDPRNPFLVTGGAVLTGLGWELGAFSVIAVFGLLAAPRLLGRRVLPAGWTLFCWAWAAPGLLTFVFVHIGQVVYVQVFAPALFLCLGPALSATAEAIGRPRWAPAIAGLSVAAGLLVFLWPARGFLAYDLRQGDLRTQGLLAVAGSLDPARSVLVGDAYGVGSYRIVSYYLPDHPRAGLGLDTRGRLREIFGDAYDPAGSRESRPFAFPDRVTEYLYLDRSLLGYLADAHRLTRVELPDGSSVYLWQGHPPAVIANRVWVDRRVQPGARATDS